MSKKLKQAGYLDPYLIAEIGVNHFDIAQKRDIDPMHAAKEMISEAADSGVDAVKFQSYSADTIASQNSPAYWDTEEEQTDNQYDLFKKYDSFEASDFEELACWNDNNFDIDFLSTPFSHYAVEYLESLVPAYKVASADINNEPLLQEIAKKNKPVLLSTGASTISEIGNAIEMIKSTSQCSDIYILHCVLEYPTDKTNANLRMIDYLQEVFPEQKVGYSDHVPADESMITLLNAAVQGATAIEKHFTLNKDLEGNDHYHAMDPDDVRTFKNNLELLSETRGNRQKRPIGAEADSRKYARRSIVTVNKIKEGNRISKEDIMMKRPGTGVKPKMKDKIVGMRASCDIPEDTILQWDMF